MPIPITAPSPPRHLYEAGNIRTGRGGSGRASAKLPSLDTWDKIEYPCNLDGINLLSKILITPRNMKKYNNNELMEHVTL